MEFRNKKLKEFEDYIRYRKVALIGLGVSNLPLLDYLYEKKVRVIVFDERTIGEISVEIITKIKQYNFELILGPHCLLELQGFDLIFRSPSCLPTKQELIEEENKGAIIITEIEMLMKMAPCKIIGITGSDGKTTTTSMINDILKKAGYNTYLGGNIGVPLFTKLNEMKPEDILVLELSSFQLMGMEVSPDIAVMTNITPNHLNIHKDYSEYINAKKNIYRYQDEKGLLILNYDNEITNEASKEANGKIIFFSGKNKIENGYIVDNNIIKLSEDNIRKHILDTKDVILKGHHNYENIATALAATSTLVDIDIAVEAIKEFKPVEHRLEYIREIEGVKWYNDSVSSSPTRTIAGLESFDEEIILIAGGYDKNLDYTSIAKPIVEKVNTLILIGQTSKKINDAVLRELNTQNKELDIYMCETLEETINIAYDIATPGQIVLFSPASASFDMFKNFADRGEKFKKIVKEIE